MSKKNLSKKEQFIRPQKSNFPKIAVAACVVLLAVVVYVLFSGGKADSTAYFGEPVTTGRSYIGQQVSMTVVEPEIESGQLRIPFETIDQNNIVYFETVNSDSELVSLMAYVTPSGRLFAGSSLCEPCQGRRFTLAGETLVCNTCRTTYDIEDHEFLSGSPACGSYPPVNMNPKIEEGDMIIDLDQILNWKSRV